MFKFTSEVFSFISSCLTVASVCSTWSWRRSVSDLSAVNCRWRATASS